MNRRFLFLSFLLFFLLFLFTFSGVEISALSSSTIALINGNLIDGTGGPLLFQAVVIIEKGLIADFGYKNKIRIPADATIIDLKGSTLLPGFINAHVHHGYSNFNLNAWAKSGVTTVRDLGGNPRNDLFAFRDAAIRDSQNARLVAAGPMVTVPKGYPMVPWGAPTGLLVRSPDDARNKVSRLLDEGADVIKIALEGGKSFNRKIPRLSNKEAAAIVAVAHQRGTVVSAHVLVSGDLENALNAGVDDIAHMVWDELSDSLIERMIDEGVYWVPTLELWYAVNPSLGRAASQNLSRFVKAGGKVALGTDFDGYDSEFDPGMPIREIRWMQAAGMTPMQIIIAATKNAACVCNLENKIGTVEKGKSADLLIVNGDPLADINVVLKKRMVINRGKIIYRR